MLNASNPLKCRLLRYNKRGKKRMTKCQSKMDSNAVSGTQPLLLDYIKDQFLPLNRRSWSTQAGDHLIWFISICSFPFLHVPMLVYEGESTSGNAQLYLRELCWLFRCMPMFGSWTLLFVYFFFFFLFSFLPSIILTFRIGKSVPHPPSSLSLLRGVGFGHLRQRSAIS